jgi:hypothetical protein
MVLLKWLHGNTKTFPHWAPVFSHLANYGITAWTSRAIFELDLIV